MRKTRNLPREVWIKISIEKINVHEEFITKILLNFETTGLFICFKLLKLEQLVLVKNIDETYSIRRITKYKIKVNLYY